MIASQAEHAPFEDLIETSFDEAAFLWGRWERELTSLARNLDEVWDWTEDRLHGALDGVRVAGDGVVELASKELTSDDPHRAAAAACLLASSRTPAARAEFAAILQKAQGPQLSSLMRGLELAGSNEALRVAATILAAGGPDHSAALCRLKAFRRAVPSQEIVTAFESNLPDAQADALRVARQLDAEHLQQWVIAGVRSPHATARLAAIESGLRRVVPQAWQAVLEQVQSLDANSGVCLSFVGMLGDGRSQESVFTALRDPKLQRAAIWALGHVGTRKAVEACLYGMQHEQLARASAEAYCWITGADLIGESLAADEPVAEVPEFDADDLNANLVPAVEETWPLPDPSAVRRHWEQHQSVFRPDVRYLRGRVANLDNLLAAMESGPMLRRPDLAIELAARTQGRYDLEPRAFAVRQRTMMTQGRSSLSGSVH